MASNQRPVVAVAGEDHAHRVLAMRLLDVVVLRRGQTVGWPEEDQLDQAREWRGLQDAPEGEEHTRFYVTKKVEEDLASVLGHRFTLLRIGDEPAGPARPFVALYTLFAQRDPVPDALIGVADSQNDPDLPRHAERAAAYIRTRLQPKMAFAFGVPHRDAEGWFVAALTEADAPGRPDAVAALKFDPLREPERLTAQPNDALRDAKRVLRFLLGRGGATLSATPSGALSREEYEALADWTPEDLTRLSSYAACGLAAFLEELEAKVAPRIVPGPPP